VGVIYNDENPHPVVVRFRTRGWSHPWHDRFEERAAIMEFDGGMSREDAEREAYRTVLAEMKEARMS
jgi:hypothetical protein